MSPFFTGAKWLLLFQCAGKVVSRMLGLPGPGPVVGMLPLFIALRVRDRVPESIGVAADARLATGIIGVSLGKYVFDAIGVRDWRARGFALGLASHGIGTARAFQVNQQAGTYAGLAFGLHSAFAAILLPFLWRLVQLLTGKL
jgi:putative effector of murein hydrolase